MKKQNKNKKKLSNKSIRKILLIFLLLILIFMAVIGLKILQSMNEYNTGNNAYEEIQNIAVNNDYEDISERIDFDALKEINPDVVGWITLNGTVIDYPVVKGEDNEYYLHHLYTGEWNSLGSLFVDFRNRDLFQDQVSVIYGHSMLNGSMFFILERYERQSFYEEHKEFIFETPDKTYILEPIAGKTVDAKIPFLQFNFVTEEEYEAYINEFIRTSTFRSESEFNKTDRTVMMIKCSDDCEDARYVLVCKVTEYSENKH